MGSIVSYGGANKPSRELDVGCEVAMLTPVFCLCVSLSVPLHSAIHIPCVTRGGEIA